MMPDLGGVFETLAVLAIVGLLALAGGGLWLAYYLIAHLAWVG
jgi:hypothetical protein